MSAAIRTIDVTIMDMTNTITQWKSDLFLVIMAYKAMISQTSHKKYDLLIQNFGKNIKDNHGGIVSLEHLIELQNKDLNAHALGFNRIDWSEPLTEENIKELVQREENKGQEPSIENKSAEQWTPAFDVTPSPPTTEGIKSNTSKSPRLSH